MIITSKNPYSCIFTLFLLAHTSLTPMTQNNARDTEMTDASSVESPMIIVHNTCTTLVPYFDPADFIRATLERQSYIQEIPDIHNVIDMIRSLTGQELVSGSLVDDSTRPGEVFDAVRMLDNAECSALLMDRLCQAFSNNLGGLQQALTQLNNEGYTALMLATLNYRSAATTQSLIQALLFAFAYAPIELQQTLTVKNFDADTALTFATNRCLAPAVQSILHALQCAYVNDILGLQQALTHENNHGSTAFMLAAARGSAPMLHHVLQALKTAFINDSAGFKEAITHQSRNGYTALTMAALKGSAPCVQIIVNALEEAFNDDRKGLQEALTHQDGNRYTALINAAYNSTKSALIILEALKDAFAHQPKLLLYNLTLQNQYDYDALSSAQTQESKEIIQEAINEARRKVTRRLL